MNAINKKTRVFKLKKWHFSVVPLSEMNLFLKKKKRNLGINVEEKHMDIKRIFMKKYAQVVQNAGCEAEDVLQEVYKTILRKNVGNKPYDPSKSAFSTYVMMICHCVVSNYLTKANKYTMRKMDLEDVKINESDLGKSSKNQEEDILIKQIRESMKDDLKVIFDRLLEGQKLCHISKELRISNRELKKRISHIQKQVAPKLGRRC
jgi:RNA polymerase sigma factor (sigma-70 family)